MDLRGPKAFTESLTPQSKLVVGDVGFDSFFSAVTPGSILLLE